MMQIIVSNISFGNENWIYQVCGNKDADRWQVVMVPMIVFLIVLMRNPILLISRDYSIKIIITINGNYSIFVFSVYAIMYF